MAGLEGLSNWPKIHFTTMGEIYKNSNFIPRLVSYHLTAGPLGMHRQTGQQEERLANRKQTVLILSTYLQVPDTVLNEFYILFH